MMLVLAVLATVLATVARGLVMARTLRADPDNTEFLVVGRSLWDGAPLYTGDMPTNRVPGMHYLLGWAPSIAHARALCAGFGVAAVIATALLAAELGGPVMAGLAVAWLLSQGALLGALVDHSYHGIVGAALALGTWGLVTRRPWLVVLCALVCAAIRLFYAPLLGLAIGWAVWQGAWGTVVGVLPVVAFLAHPRRRAILAYVPGFRWATSAQVDARFRWVIDGASQSADVNSSLRDAGILAWRQYRLVALGLAGAIWAGHLPAWPMLVCAVALACAVVSVPYAASAMGYVQTLGPLLVVLCASAGATPLALACLIAGPWSSRPLGLPATRFDPWTQAAQSASIAALILWGVPV